MGNLVSREIDCQRDCGCDARESKPEKKKLTCEEMGYNVRNLLENNRALKTPFNAARKLNKLNTQFYDKAIELPEKYKNQMISW
jgi:hypothetical protein